jgi:hypothetical protein
MKVGLVYTPREIYPDILAWLTQGWTGSPDEALSFLKHISALRQGVALGLESFIVVEAGVTPFPEIGKNIPNVITKIPAGFTTCLLSHYVTSWDGINFVEGTDKTLCHISDHVHSSFAYWIRSSHAEYLLGMYDQPLRNLPNFKITAESISRFGRVCMVYQPLFAYVERSPFKEYFYSYGYLQN